MQIYHRNRVVKMRRYLIVCDFILASASHQSKLHRRKALKLKDKTVHFAQQQQEKRNEDENSTFADAMKEA